MLLLYVTLGALVILALASFHQPHHAPVSLTEWLIGWAIWPALLVAVVWLLLKMIVTATQQLRDTE